MKFVSSVVSIFAVAGAVSAADIKYLWSPDGLDTAGNVIPVEALSYNLYVSTDGGEYALLTLETGNMYVWENAPEGCHKAYITAYRADADLESEASNAIEKCVTADTDDQIRALIPRTPADFRANWRARR